MSVPLSGDLLHCSLLLAFPQVYHLLPQKESQGYSFREYYLEEDNVNPCVSLDNLSLNGFLYVPISSDGEGDTYEILKVSTSLSFFSFAPFLNLVSSLLTCPKGPFNKEISSFAVNLLMFVCKKITRPRSHIYLAHK